jgi:salicylate hydroxylase
MFPQVSHHGTLLTYSLFSITLREGEARESWRAVDQHEVDKIKRTPIAQWGFGASRLIESAERVVKVCRTLRWRCHSNVDLDFEISFLEFGLYDRPGLRSWHKGRIVLLGDAAHPTPPVWQNLPITSIKTVPLT